MAIVTIRFAHLKNFVLEEEGHVYRFGDVVGVMGTTGASTGEHLHLDGVFGEVFNIWRMSAIDHCELKYAPEQVSWFIDDDLFGEPLRITSYTCDPKYFTTFGKIHWGLDLVPKIYSKNANYPIHWNRSKPGKLLAKGFDSGYGNYALISIEV